MTTKKTLSKLTYDDLKSFPAWAAMGNYAEDEDATLEPVQLDSEGRIPSDLEEIWCLCTACFADGSERLAAAMCRADSSDGPLLWSVWNGADDVPLFLPPTPPSVLSKKGPDVFAASFGMKTSDVFPVRMKVVARFATAPEERSVDLSVAGIVPGEQ